jgi:F-type H+-transporting ATPase subunit delta
MGAAVLAGRYAGALFELAEQGGLLDRVAADLAELGEMIGENDDLYRLINSPLIPRADQARGLDRIVEKAEMSDLVRNFVGVVAGNGRLFALSAMIAAFHKRLARERGEVQAQIISASALSGKQTTNIVKALKKAVGAAVDLETKVDPGILGGLIVRVGSRMVDNSVGSKLERLGLVMKGIG